MSKKAGVPVDRQAVRLAFQFFDADSKGFLTLNDLKKRLSLFYQNLSLREYKFLMNGKAQLSEDELFALLEDNELTDYDPVAEAFRIYDPQGTGFVDLEVFKEVMGGFGLKDVDSLGIDTLLQVADFDGDGKISLEDFRRILPRESKEKERDRERERDRGDATGKMTGPSSFSSLVNFASSLPNHNNNSAGRK